VAPVPDEAVPLLAHALRHVGPVERIHASGGFARVLFSSGVGWRAIIFCELVESLKLTTVHTTSIDGGED
jgi:hypothetical protein